MFHKTTLRLTGLYLLIIMAISLFFSVVVYSLATLEVDRTVQRQSLIISDLPDDQVLLPSLQRRLAEGRRSAADEAKAHLAFNLAVANVGILVLAGGFSYVLAKRSLEPIEKAHRELEQFTADASHELRTPLAAMRSEIEVSLMDKKLSAKDARAVLESNLEEVDSLTNLTAGLLSLARLEDGVLDIKEQHVQPVLQRALKLVETQGREKAIRFSIPKNVPQNARFDSGALEQVLVILLQNAVKYSDQKATIIVTIETKRDVVRVSVVDTGKGISSESLPHIFDRFYQADTARSGNGHGLGLSIAKRLTELQGGSLSVQSIEGKGSTFIICLRR